MLLLFNPDLENPDFQIRNFKSQVLEFRALKIPMFKDPDFQNLEFQNHLQKVFRMADANGSGLLSHSEINNLFHSLSIHLNPFELSVIISEADLNHDGLINYEEFVPVCSDLIRVKHTHIYTLTIF